MDKNYLLAFKKNIINLKKILVITYYWPPSGGPGVQRVLKYCKYLPKYGWEPIILTVSDGDFPVLDESLALEVENFKVFKTKSFSFHKIFNFLNKKSNTPTFQLSSSDKDSLFVRFSRWIRLNIIIPDGRIGWLPGAVKKGNYIIGKYKIDAIFSSAPPYTTHLIAKSLSISNKIPWVADFRDPWTDRFYNYENKRWWLTQKLDKYLEHSVIKNADRCISVSRTISKYYKKSFEIIHNGYDEDFLTKNDLSKSNEIIFIGNLKRFNEERGLKMLIDAFTQTDIGENYRLTIVGGPKKEAANLEKYKQRHDLHTNINIVGPKTRSEISGYLKDSSIGVLLNSSSNIHSYLFSSPLKYFEYIFNKLKVIAVDFPAHRELPYSENIVFFKENNIKSLVEAIKNTSKIEVLELDTIRSLTVDERVKKIIAFANS